MTSFDWNATKLELEARRVSASRRKQYEIISNKIHLLNQYAETEWLESTDDNQQKKQQELLGDNRDLVPLLPISNRTVKRVIADDSVVRHAKVGHCQAPDTKPRYSLGFLHSYMKKTIQINKSSTTDFYTIATIKLIQPIISPSICQWAFAQWLLWSSFKTLN